MATAVKPAEDLFTLANRLRDKGLEDDDLVDALTGLGFTKKQARDAAASTAPPAAEEPAAAEDPEAILPVSDPAAEGSRGGTGGRPRTPRRPAPRGSRSRGRRGSFGGVQRGIDKGLREAGSLSLTPPKRLTVKAGAGFAGGLLLYVLALNYLRYGPDGVKGWLAAKFVNRPMSAPGSAIDEGIRAGQEPPTKLGKRAPKKRRDRDRDRRDRGGRGADDEPGDPGGIGGGTYLATTRPQRPQEV